MFLDQIAGKAADDRLDSRAMAVTIPGGLQLLQIDGDGRLRELVRHKASLATRFGCEPGAEVAQNAAVGIARASGFGGDRLEIGVHGGREWGIHSNIPLSIISGTSFWT